MKGRMPLVGHILGRKLSLGCLFRKQKKFAQFKYKGCWSTNFWMLMAGSTHSDVPVLAEKQSSPCPVSFLPWPWAKYCKIFSWASRNCVQAFLSYPPTSFIVVRGSRFPLLDDFVNLSLLSEHLESPPTEKTVALSGPSKDLSDGLYILPEREQSISNVCGPSPCKRVHIHDSGAQMFSVRIGKFVDLGVPPSLILLQSATRPMRTLYLAQGPLWLFIRGRLVHV